MQQQLFEWKKSFTVNWVQFCPHWEFGQLETEADLQQLACDFVVFGICKYFQVAPFVHCRQFGQPLKIFDKALFDKDFSCCNISVNMVFIMFLTWSNPHYQNIFQNLEIIIVLHGIQPSRIRESTNFAILLNLFKKPLTPPHPLRFEYSGCRFDSFP